MNQIFNQRPSNEMLIIKDDSFESFNSNPSYKHIKVTAESYSVNFCLGIFYYLLWGALFTIFTSNENYFTEECEDEPLMGWSKAIGISNIICSIISICVIPMLIFYINKKSKNATVYSYYETVDNGMKMARKSMNIIRILLILNFAFFYIAAVSVYSLELYCKHLGTLMFLYILMCSVFIAIIIFMIVMYACDTYHKRVQSQELKFKYIH